MAISDAHGRLLWVEGHPVVRRRGERMNFTDGAVWDERQAGTNAPGTALALNEAVQVVGAEHLTRVVQPWTCSPAPGRDPFSREILGVIDLTGGDHLAMPSSLALVRAAALAAEAELARLGASRAHTQLWPPGVRTGAIPLEVLGRDEEMLALGSSRQRLTRRHCEILTILVEHPAGLTGEQLGLELYGDQISPVTRAELVRPRRPLGADALCSRPYRPAASVTSDLTDVRRLLDSDDVAGASAEYRGPLLALPQAPGMEQTRWLLEQRLRAGVLGSADPDLLSRWTSTRWLRDDPRAWELLAGRAHASASRSLARAQVRRLVAGCGVPVERCRPAAPPPRGPMGPQPRSHVSSPDVPIPAPRENDQRTDPSRRPLAVSVDNQKGLSCR